MQRIFVAYRRKDSTSETGRIVQSLRRRFGRRAVFHDVGDIKGGDRWRDVIASELENAGVVLIVIGETWLEIDDNGQRRIDDPEDQHRFEIECALSKTNCTVIPVLVGNAKLPEREQLPDQIAGIVDRNAAKIRPDPDFLDDMQDLSELLADKLPQERRRATRNRALAMSCAVITLIAAGWLFWWALQPPAVQITTKGWPGYAPLWIADRMNLCDGVDINFVEVIDVDDAIQHIDQRGEKRADMGYWLTDSHVIARLDGVPAVVVLKVDISLEADAMIAFSEGEKAIRKGRYEDLAGKRIAFQRNDPSHSLLLALTRGTVDGESRQIECKWVETGVEEAMKEFEKGDAVDAAISYEPYLSKTQEALNAKGIKTHRPFTGKDLNDMGHPITDLLVVREDYLKAYPNRVKSIIKGTLRVVELLEKKDEVAIQHFCEFMEIYSPKDNDEPYSKSDFYDLVNKDQMILSDANENRAFFFPESDEETHRRSVFRRQLADAEKQWRSWNESSLGGAPFDVGTAIGAGDGSSILREALQELDDENR